MDNFTPFHTQYYDYKNNELSKIVIKDKNDKVVDEILIECVNKDEKGTCLKQIRTSAKTKDKEEIHFSPKYN